MIFSNNDVSSIMNSYVTGAAQRTADPELDSDDFLLLLVAQMQNQDPLSPMDQQSFMGELAQFNSLQQQVDLNDAFLHFMQFQELTQATSMIGKDVVALVKDAAGEVVSAEGTVTEVYFTSTGAYLLLDDGSEVSIQDVVNVKMPTE
jgi:flagellar basal-body rod modification protein FlgD